MDFITLSQKLDLLIFGSVFYFIYYNNNTALGSSSLHIVTSCQSNSPGVTNELSSEPEVSLCWILLHFIPSSFFLYLSEVGNKSHNMLSSFHFYILNSCVACHVTDFLSASLFLCCYIIENASIAVLGMGAGHSSMAAS